MPYQNFLHTLPITATTLPTFSSSAKTENYELEDACAELESLFIYYLLKEMRSTIPKSGIIGRSKSEEIYTSLLDLQFARKIAENKSIGISSILVDQLENVSEKCRLIGENKKENK